MIDREQEVRAARKERATSPFMKIQSGSHRVSYSADLPYHEAWAWTQTRMRSLSASQRELRTTRIVRVNRAGFFYRGEIYLLEGLR